MVVPEAIPRRGLTQKFIEALKARPGSYELVDPATIGLALRVLPSGVKSWRWRARSLKRVVTIGPWTLVESPGHITLREARDWVERLRAARKAGPLELDRVEALLRDHLAPQRPGVAGATGTTVAMVAEKFLKLMDTQRKRPEAARYVVEKDITPAIGHLPLRALKKSDCVAVVQRVNDRGSTTHSGKVLGLLKQLLDYAENIEDEFVNPAARLKAANLGVLNGIRDRWLTDEEIPLFWRALAVDPGGAPKRSVPDPRTAAALRIILLTAVRSCEIRLSRWTDVDLKAATWTIPVANQKLTLKQARQAKPFVIPLPPTALGLFEELQELAGDSEWVLASEADKGFYTDKALGKAMRRMWMTHPVLLKLPTASPHDLRRTARTWIGKLGTAPHIAERCLNHSVGRIAKTYDQGDYLDERRAALEKLDAFVQRLLNPTSNISFLPKASVTTG